MEGHIGKLFQNATIIGNYFWLLKVANSFEHKVKLAQYLHYSDN
jgi:hypothetical protein